jgi:hypothetical protein
MFGINFYKLKQDSIIWIKKITNKNWVAKFIVLLIIWPIALIPTWLYMLIRYLISPFGFWQELATFLVCAIFIGWIQVIGLFIAVAMSLVLMFDDLR